MLTKRQTILLFELEGRLVEGAPSEEALKWGLDLYDRVEIEITELEAFNERLVAYVEAMDDAVSAFPFDLNEFIDVPHPLRFSND